MKLKMLKENFRKLLVTLGGILLIATGAHGQICAGSHLTYIVRDTKGVAIDASGKHLHYEGDSDSPYGRWYSSDRDFIRSRTMQVPDEVNKLRGRIAALEVSGMCIFKQPVNLQLTFAGKTMNLTFLMPRLGEYDSRDFLVDSLPFRQGAFEMELTVNPDHTSRFYPATNWKKVKR